MPSRRAVLAAASTAVGSVLAGCGGYFSGEGSSDQGGVRSCRTTAVDREESSDLIQQAAVSADDSSVFRVVLNRDAPGFESFNALVLTTASDERYYLPRDAGSSRRIYQQSIGDFPQNGRIQTVAHDRENRLIDSLTVEFTCYRTTPNPEG